MPDVIEEIRQQEARLLLRFAARDLSRIERLAVEGFAAGLPQRSLARAEIGFRRGAIFYAQKRGLRKMRAQLERLGIFSAGEIL